MKKFAENNRILLREIEESDIDDMFEMDSDPEVHRYLGNSPVTSKNQIEEVIHFIRNQYKENGIGRWAVIDKETNEMVGWSGFKLITETTNGQVGYYDFGYRFKRKHCGKGFAMESALLSLYYAFDEMHLKKVMAIADCKNEVSNYILQKLGFRLIEDFDYDGVLHNWYELTIDSFKNSQ